MLLHKLVEIYFFIKKFDLLLNCLFLFGELKKKQKQAVRYVMQHMLLLGNV